MSELQRWKSLYMVEYYRMNPDKLPKETAADVTLEESEDRALKFFGVTTVTEIE